MLISSALCFYLPLCAICPQFEHPIVLNHSSFGGTPLCSALRSNVQGKSELEQLKEAFFNFDVDRDGFISCEDMKVFLMTKGAKMSREEVCDPTWMAPGVFLYNPASLSTNTAFLCVCHPFNHGGASG